MKIEVDGTLTIDQLLDKASYGKVLFNNGFVDRKFPVKDPQKRTVNVTLLKIAKKDRFYIESIINKQGFRSLFIEELLEFSYTFPEKQETCEIITLDCFKYGDHGKLYPCLGAGFFGRQIGLRYVDSDVNFATTKFAVTKI
jgi:hypothetical protein